MMLFILTANYNSGNGLLTTWESLRHQTHCDFRWLIKDNYSTDGSLEIALSIEKSDPRVSVHLSHDSGIYDALNHLIDFIDPNSFYLTLGSSDTLFPYSLESINDLCSTFPSNDIFFFGLYVGNKRVLPMKYFGYFLGLRGCGSSHSVGSVINTRLHDIYGKYDTSLSLLADQLFLKTCIRRRASIFRSPLIVGNYALGGASSCNPKLFREQFLKVQLATESFPIFQHILFLLRNLFRPL